MFNERKVAPANTPLGGKTMWVEEMRDDEPREETLANARLIAAAPDLLEAAENASEHLKDLIRHGSSHITCEGCAEDIFQATQWLDEAINKAEGRE